VRDAAREIVALGPRAAVMKGGHAAGDVVVDVLFDGVNFREYAAPRVDTRSTHGTGCTFASAIAAGLAQGLGVEEAVAQAKEYVTAALRNAKPIGGGHGPVHHFYGFWKE
jgi:hydroxymethylpyrimidine/phosphomethylpyrimidine kinase